MNKKHYLIIVFVLVLVVSAFFIGTNYSRNTSYGEQISTSENSDLETAVKNYPRGVLDVPAQWFMMEGLVGWEKMMFIFGYADNRDVCYHLVDVAREESPNRNFRCEDAN